MVKLNSKQLSQAQDSYHYALAAAGGNVDGHETTFTGPAKPYRTRTEFLVAAWKGARLLDLPVKRPRGPVDAADLARSILTLCAERGCNAFTGSPIVVEAPPTVEPVTDYEEELEPERPHRCKNNGGFCNTCFDDVAA